MNSSTAATHATPVSNMDPGLMIICGNSAIPGSAFVGASHEDLALALAPGLATDLQALQAEAMGWIPLEDRAYLHLGESGKPDESIEIQVVGIPDVQMAHLHVLLMP